MRQAGVVSEDEPDPRITQAEALKMMPVPVMGFASQPSLEDDGFVSLNYGEDDRGVDEISATVTYRLWRNPFEKADPSNLVELDDEIRKALEQIQPWPRPAWLIAQAERIRYPQLWEAVRTSWHRENSEFSTLHSILVDHANYVLMNCFPSENASRTAMQDSPVSQLSERNVDPRVTVRINGTEVSAAEINTDIHVYAIGAELETGGVLTAVIPRRELKYVVIEFATRD